MDLEWGGVSLRDEFGMRLSSFSCDPPSPKTVSVSIPGGVDLDLTDALTGHAAFENRRMTLEFFYDGRGRSETWQDAVNRLTNAISGVESDFTLGWDPGYTYHGRASVTSVEHSPQFYATVAVEITASPWKLRELHALEVYASGGVSVTCRSGRRPVHPIVRSDVPVSVEWEGQSLTVPAGSGYRLVGVTFRQGDNRLWLSALRLGVARWSDLSGETWAGLGSATWGNVRVASDSAVWSDLSGETWASLAGRSWAYVAGEMAGEPEGGSVRIEWEESYL